jgi:hypothetical protein
MVTPRLLILALAFLLYPITSQACVGGDGNSSQKTHYTTIKFSGEARFGEQTDVKMDSGFVFRLKPTYTGWEIEFLHTGGSYEIQKKDRIINLANVNKRTTGRDIPFTFDTMSFDAQMASGIVLGSISSDAERKAAIAELNKYYMGYGNFRALDVKTEKGVSRNLEYEKLTYLKFEGEIKYPSGHSASFCVE